MGAFPFDFALEQRQAIVSPAPKFVLRGVWGREDMELSDAEDGPCMRADLGTDFVLRGSATSKYT